MPLTLMNQRARFLRVTLILNETNIWYFNILFTKNNKIHKFTHIALRVRAKNCKRQFTQHNPARSEHTGSQDHCVSLGSQPRGSPGLRCRVSCRSSSRRRALCVLGGTGPATNEVSCQCENYGSQLNGTTFSQLMLWRKKQCSDVKKTRRFSLENMSCQGIQLLTFELDESVF